MSAHLPRPAFWQGKRVLVTGATGFKGAWLCNWLESMGANVSGFALPSHHDPSIFTLSNIGARISYASIDVRERAEVKDFVRQRSPEIVLHLAAQAIVLTGIDDPVTTFETNALGTLNILEACRDVDALRAVVVVTSDKVYGETGRICRESDPLGGTDPYSASKACAELITGVYARHYLTSRHDVGLATARAGNVIGGGDFNPYRLLPDLVRGAIAGETVIIRSPSATRPWQHVLDALSGYLCLAERLWKTPALTAPSWNFGPVDQPDWTVARIVDAVTSKLGGRWRADPSNDTPEATALRLSSRSAVQDLGWEPRLTTRMAVEWTIDAYLALFERQSTDWLAKQIARFEVLPSLSADRMEGHVAASA